MAIPSWLLPVGLALGVVGIVAMTRRTDPAARDLPVTGPGGMRDAMQPGDVIHITPYEVIPGLTPLPHYLVVAKVLSVGANTVRAEATHVGGTPGTLQPVPPSTHDFVKDHVITIIRDGVEIA